MVDEKEIRKALIDELLVLADTNWVLGHWHLKNLLNSRSLQGGAALSAMAQDTLGHTRATFNYLESCYGIKEGQLEFGRKVNQLHSLEMLDSPPESYGDFVISLLLAEQAIWLLGGTLNGSRDKEISGMISVFAKEAKFHRLNMRGWLTLFTDKEKSDARTALAELLPKVIAWFGSEQSSDQDILLAAGIKTSSSWAAREKFVEWSCARLAPALDMTSDEVMELVERADPVSCDNPYRRPDGTSIPASLWEYMVPTTHSAKIARRTLDVSIEDSIDYYDKPETKAYDFEPIPVNQ